MDWRERIVFDPEICHGRPCIRGTRVLVSAILDNIADGETDADILRSYPSIAVEDIRAAVAYAAELAHEQVVRLP